MDRYIVESPHTEGDCKKALKDVLSVGYLTHFDWGCKDGDHRGWVIIEADSPEEALMVVPSIHRPLAKVVKLVKFSREQVEKMHVDVK